MRATIADNKWIYFDNITEYEEEILWTGFSVAAKNSKYINPNQMTHIWDGVYRKYNRVKKRIARPFLSMLRGLCSSNNVPLEVNDIRDDWQYQPVDVDSIDDSFLPGIKLDEHQVRAIKKSCNTECGVINVPTGGGKGEIICGICKANPCPTMIVADQRVVVDQLKSRLELRQIGESIGLFYAGERPNGEMIVVGSVQSLQTPPQPKPPDIRDFADTDDTTSSYNAAFARWEKSMVAYNTRKKNAKFLQKYISKAEMILVDECDKATSKPYQSLFKMFNGRKRFGFSGTPFDKDKPVEAIVMQEHLGSVIAKESRAKLVEIGRIISCDYKMLAVGPFDGRSNKAAYDIAKNTHIVDNEHLHKLICGICLKYPNDGTLILVDRDPLGERLVEMLANYNIQSSFIHGKTPTKTRNNILRSFEKREIKVLVGGKIINRGLDLSGGCENLVIATGGKLQSEFEQKIGRALRLNKMGKSRIFDFFFMCNKYLYEHSKARLNVMISLQYATEIIFPRGSVPGTDIVARNYNISKKLFT